MSDPVIYNAVDGIATVTINRPEARNGLTDGAAGAIHRVIERASRDSSIRVLVLRGAGRDFCVGADINAYEEARDGDAQGLSKDISHYQVPVLLHTMPAVTIAAIRGGCAGAGLGWAAACDLRVAAPSARFNSAFLAVGVAGDMGLPWSLPRLIGAARAREMMYLPRKFDAAEAQAMGIVSRMLSDEHFDAELAELAGGLARRAPLALKALKAHFLAAETMDLTGYIDLETNDHTAIFASHDRAEAFAAFVEKRSPRFEGR